MKSAFANCDTINGELQLDVHSFDGSFDRKRSSYRPVRR